MYRFISVRPRLLSGNFLGQSCLIVCSFVLFVLCLFVILVIFSLGFEDRIWVLLIIAYLLLLHKNQTSVCLLFSFVILSNESNCAFESRKGFEGHLEST